MVRFLSENVEILRSVGMKLPSLEKLIRTCHTYWRGVP